jgi:hypothetical protein
MKVDVSRAAEALEPGALAKFPTPGGNTFRRRPRR